MASDRIGRRGVLGSGLALGAAALAPRALGGCDQGDAPRGAPAPLAQDGVVVARIPDDGRFYYMHDPGMACMPDGAIVVAAPCLERPTRTSFAVASWRTFVARSTDRGRTFQPMPTLPYSDGSPFVHDGRLYMFVQPEKWRDVSIVRSDDLGATWTPPSRLFAGAYWNADAPVVLDRGRLLWAVHTRDYQGGVVVLAADPARDLLDPATWRMSSEAVRPTTPAALLPPGKDGKGDWWLEPNVVVVRGKVRVILRTILGDYATSGLAAFCDLTDEPGRFALDFTQLHPMACGQCKVYVVWDEPSGLFWMLGNLPADTQERVFDWRAVREGGFLGGGGNDRRFLVLSYSVDAMSWFTAGVVARTQNLHQSYMYPSADIDGPDLVLVSRTSRNGRDQHDADTVTFHRVRDFRSLAMDLRHTEART